MGANLLSAHGLLEVPVFEKGAWLLSARRSYTDYIQSSLYNDIYGFLTGDQETNRQGGPMRLRQGNFGRNRNIATGATEPDFYFYDVNSKLTVNPTQKDILTLSLYNGKDNRDNSQDSRIWGALHKKYIKAKPLFLYFSWAPDPRAPKWKRPYFAAVFRIFFYNLTHFPLRIRWDRIGNIIE